jgi:hypothetical protein
MILFLRKKIGTGRCYTSVIPAPRRQRQEDHEFQASLRCIASPCLKTKRKKEKRN